MLLEVDDAEEEGNNELKDATPNGNNKQQAKESDDLSLRDFEVCRAILEQYCGKITISSTESEVSKSGDLLD